jgi:uncharacterized protein YcbK (DUF882 family)
MNKLKISKNFSLHEFECHDGSHLVKLDEVLIEKLQQLRDKIGLPITINSGYRTPEHNTKIGGAPKSQHMLGKAADISVRGWTAKQITEMAETIGFGGIGIYHKQNFVHVDVRETKTRWEE